MNDGPKGFHAIAQGTREVLACLLSWWRRWAPIAVLGLAVVLALVILGTIPIRGASTARRRAVRPYEYMYLDHARLEAYLGQLNGGNVAQETRTNSSKESAGAKFEVEAIGGASGSVSREKISSAVALLSDADNFYKLEQALEADGSLADIQLAGSYTQEAVHNRIRKEVAKELNRRKPPPNEAQALRREQLEAKNEQQLESLPIGAMVKLEGAELRVPPYLAAYPSLRYATPRFNRQNPAFEAAPLSQFGAAEIAVKASAMAEREKFIASAGANPRLPLSATLGELTIVMPARYADITGDPSLLGTSVTIVGKLVHKGANFGDAASEATYLPALLGADQQFLRDIGVKHSFLQKYGGERHTLDVQLFKALQRSLTFTGKTVEVIPVAIYD